MSAGHTPGPWAVDADPVEDQDYETLIVLPGPNGSFPTWIARAEHNWNEAGARQRRISWAESQANARLIAAAPELLELACQYLSDLHHPPQGDSLKRRIERAEKIIAKARGQ